MSLYDSALYMEDVRCIAKASVDWDKLKDKSIAISGGTGMIGSFLVDVLMYRNKKYNQNTHIYVIGRSEEKAAKRFSEYANEELYHFAACDINREQDMRRALPGRIDYVLHGASNTHPKAYATDPIGTISANVIGARNLLDWAADARCIRFAYLSSVEIYGENKGDIDKFHEEYLGYIDCNTMRAGYPESKRVGEALCQAYICQKNMDIVIPRLSRVYGPTMLATDTKALSQFIQKGVKGEDIVLKSEGTQEYSYSYVADAVYGLLFVLLNGEKGQAYNIASKESDIMLKDLATLIAKISGTKVVFELPDEIEKAGYSKATKATLDVSKINRAGFDSIFGIEEGIAHTMEILKEMQ
ncbi:MAG: NAD-dependent epimerase/dehydratase family protein [Wujia sp.]